MAAGLGSSAAAAVAGLRVFERVTRPLNDDELLALATDVEGHADNAAPALFGGLTSVVADEEHHPVALRWTWPDELRLVVATPAVKLATAKARAALPDMLSRRDAIFNLQRVLSLVHALQSTGLRPRARGGARPLAPAGARGTGAAACVRSLALQDPDVLGAFLSGAGPSVAVLARRNFERLEQLLSAQYVRAGVQVVVRTLSVHHAPVAGRCVCWENCMKFVTGLACHLCGKTYPPKALWVCSECLGPLEVHYDYAAVKAVMTRALIESRPPSLWRYQELLPVESPKTGFNSGFTPLVRATRLAKELGLAELYLKDDSVNHPTFSYKDRVVSVAATRCVELGFPVFGCASTGNLAGSVAAHAARLGLPCYVFIPHDLEPAKVLGASIYRPQVVAVEGNYDDVNRLCTQIADRYGWGFANINLRSYYAEGAKTMGFEIVEQLGWRYPDHIVSPVAGGTLLPRIYKGLRELKEVGLADGTLPKIHAAQPAGSAPVIKALEAGLEFPEPVKPDTIAKSLAIGNPADGFQVVKVVNESGGSGAMVSDPEILSAIELLAATEGIFTEPAGRHDAGRDAGR